MNIRKATINDITEIKNLLESSFKKEFPISLLKWKYFNNSFHTMNFVAEKNRKIICHYGAIFFPYSKNSDSLICIPCDAASNIKDSFFGKNLPFVKFSQYVYNEFIKFNNVEFVFTFTGERHYRLAKYIINGKDFMPIIKMKALFNHISQITYFNSLKVEETTIDNPIPEKNFTGIKKSREFLNWRYIKHPFKTYKFFKFSFLNEDIIFAVIRIYNQTLFIDDFQIISGFEHMFLPAITLICKKFTKKQITDVVIHFSANHPVAMLVRNSGIFKDVDLEPFLYSMYFGNMQINIPVEKFTFTMAEMEI